MFGTRVCEKARVSSVLGGLGLASLAPPRRWIAPLLLCALAAWGLVTGCRAQPKPYAYEYVAFDDLAPPYMTLTQSWNALGLDDQGRAYILWTGTRDDGREDTALFRYVRSSGERKLLGTFIDAATAQHNVLEGEQIPKGHTRIIQVGRKLYMASQGFHDFKAELDALPNYRGAHLFAYDLDTGAFEDVTRTLPNGVLIQHQGIVALAYSPEHDLLVGLSHPLGDIVLFDVTHGSVRKLVSGIPWQSNRVVSREIVVTRTGKIYTYRGPELPSLRDMSNEVWEYDIAADELKPTGQLLTGGFWNGQATTRDRSTIFLSTVSGELYALDVESGSFSHLGYFIDDDAYHGERQYRVRFLYGIALTASEDALIGVPIITPLGTAGEQDVTRVLSFSRLTHTFTKHVDADTAVFTGSDNRDGAGNIYMSAFDWHANCKLAVLTPPAP